jgi:hypothetical protein
MLAWIREKNDGRRWREKSTLKGWCSSRPTRIVRRRILHNGRGWSNPRPLGNDQGIYGEPRIWAEWDCYLPWSAPEGRHGHETSTDGLCPSNDWPCFLIIARLVPRIYAHVRVAELSVGALFSVKLHLEAKRKVTVETGKPAANQRFKEVLKCEPKTRRASSRRKWWRRAKWI